MSMHTCPGPGCAVAVPRSKLACRRHWSQVSASTRSSVYATYGADPGGPEHVAAMQAAIAEMTA